MKLFKKILLVLIVGLTPLILSSCGMQNKLLVLNWGEYINDEAVALFEEMYDVEVSISLSDSNELFYSKLKSGTTAYDLIIPSDYMVEKMMQKNLLQEIDFTKLTNWDSSYGDYENNPYLMGLNGIRETMAPGTENYHVPYFWGTFGLMYNKLVPGLEEALETYQWDAYFNPDLRPEGTRVGMYDTAQFAYGTAMLYNDLDPNVVTDETIEIAYDTLMGAGFEMWGDDHLKKAIAADNLDLGFVWTGDFLDMFYVALGEGEGYDDVSYNIFIPDTTFAFMDAFVIPKNARHVDLAHQFIDFFLDPDMAYLNASVIGYPTPLQETYDMITDYVGEDQWLTDWARAYEEYYPDTPDFRGIPFANLDQALIAQLTLMVNNVKTDS